MVCVARAPQCLGLRWRIQSLGTCRHLGTRVLEMLSSVCVVADAGCQQTLIWGCHWNIYVTSPCDLGLLTTWWSQGGQALYTVAQNPKANASAQKAEADLPFVTQLQQSHSTNSAAFSWLQVSHKPNQIQKEANWTLPLNGKMNGKVLEEHREWEMIPFQPSLENTIQSLSMIRKSVFTKPSGTRTVSLHLFHTAFHFIMS